jgi:hypothetical protein
VRERAESPEAAEERFLKFLQPALSCVSEARWVLPPPAESEPHRVLVTSERPMTLERQRGLSEISFTAVQEFKVVEDEVHEGEWKVQTLSYAYGVKVQSKKLKEGDSDDVLIWHWHPYISEHPKPHVHPPITHRLLGLELPKLHVPTGRVSFEDVVRFLIDELRVVPVRKDWSEVVDTTEAYFHEYRTWA